MADFQYHCTFTKRRSSGSTRAGEDESFLMVGTKEEIAKAVSESVMSLLEHGGGPFTVTPIHPVNVWKVGD